MDDYRFLLQHGHNSKGGDRIHIGWLLACTVSQAEKVLINPPENLPEKLLAHAKKRFEDIPLAPVLSAGNGMGHELCNVQDMSRTFYI